MDIEALEKLNRNRSIANSVTELVGYWMRDMGELIRTDEISFRGWCDLQDYIERYLNEQDSK